jgi:RNA polymerase sigma-70 factor (ECF subfamily)
MNDADDGEIVELVLRGNRDAFGTLVKRYQGPIYNLMYRMCGSPEDAADLAQEAFIKAYEKLETFKTGKRFFPWLYAIGLNHARDYARKRKLVTGLTDEEMENMNAANQHDHVQDRMIANLDIQRLSDAVNRLPIDYREAVLLRYRNDLALSEVAEVLGISLSGAKMRVHRALAKLREMMQEEDDQ